MSGYSIIHDVRTGTIAVTVFNGSITPQKADAVARNRAGKVRLQERQVIGTREIRVYG